MMIKTIFGDLNPKYTTPCFNDPKWPKLMSEAVKEDNMSVIYEGRVCKLCGEKFYSFEPDGEVKEFCSECEGDSECDKESYYDVGGVSTIDTIRAKLTNEQYEGFLLGNIIKYALRLNHKGQEEKDKKKLAEYAKWLEEIE